MCHFDCNFLLQCQESYLRIDIWYSKHTNIYLTDELPLYRNRYMYNNFHRNVRRYLGQNVYTASNHVTLIYFCFYYFKFLLTWPCVCTTVPRWLMLYFRRGKKYRSKKCSSSALLGISRKLYDENLLYCIHYLLFRYKCLILLVVKSTY